MTTKTSANQLANIAALAAHATEIRALGKRAFDDIVEIGRRLIEAKKICGHGNWLPWLDREFGWKEQSARNFMNVAEMAAKSPTVGDLNIDCRGLYLLAAPGTPAEVIEIIAERGKRGEKVTMEQVKELVEERKPRPKPKEPQPEIAKPTIDRGDPNRVWPKLSEAARDLSQRMIAVGPVYQSIIEHWSGDDRVAFTRLMRDPQKSLEADRSVEVLLEHVEAELAKRTQAAAQPTAPKATPVEAVKGEPAKPVAADSDAIPWPPANAKAVAKIMARNPSEAAKVVAALVPLLAGTDSAVTFTPAQQKDIDAVIKQYKKQLYASFDNAVWDEAGKRVAAQTEKLAPGLLKREEEAQEAKNRAFRQEEHYREMSAKAAIFTEAEFDAILKAAGANPSDETRHIAMVALNAQKLRLVGGPPRTKVRHGLDINIKPRNPPPPRP